MVWILIGLLLGSSGSSFAQNQKDFVLLNQLEVKKGIVNGLALHFTNRYFWNQNATELGAFFGDVGLSYQLTNRWEAGTFMRIAGSRQLNNNYETRMRFYTDVSYALPLSNKFSLKWRGRYQHQTYDWLWNETDKTPASKLRNRLILGYDYNWYWSFKVWGETFSSWEKEGFDLLNETRTCIEAAYRMNVHHAFSAYYQVRNPMVKPATQAYILGTVYRYSF